MSNETQKRIEECNPKLYQIGSASFMEQMTLKLIEMCEDVEILKVLGKIYLDLQEAQRLMLKKYPASIEDHEIMKFAIKQARDG